MSFSDRSEASFYLQHLNYYRLAAYWLPFKENGEERFKKGTDFSEILRIYRFDRELRLLLLDAIERLEVSVRSVWAYTLAHRYGSHAHLNNELFSGKRFQENLSRLKTEVGRSDEKFIRHFQQKYEEELPPIWSVCEVMSLGLLSRWYKTLKQKSARREISKIYDLDDELFGSWLHHISIVRNICAHHSRLWNREFSIKPKLPRTKPIKLVRSFSHNPAKIYNSLLILLHFMDIISPNHHWRSQIRRMLDNNSSIVLTFMGFPKNWKEHEIWQ